MGEPFYIRKTRRTLEILNICGRYVNANARSLLATITFLALPFILFPMLFSYLLTGSLHVFEFVFSYKNSLEPNSFIMLLILYLVYIVGMALLSMTVNKHLLLTDGNENSGATGIDQNRTGATWQSMIKNYAEDFKSFGINFFILFICYSILTYALKYCLNFIQVLVFPDNDPWTFEGQATVLLTQNIPFFLLRSLMIFVAVASAFVCYRDKTEAWVSAKKVWHYTKLNLKKAWLSAAFFLIVTYILLYIFNKIMLVLPGLLHFIPSASDSVLANFFAGFYLVSMAGSFLILSFLQLNIITLFGSLEDEAEGHYMKSKIEKV